MHVIIIKYTIYISIYRLMFACITSYVNPSETGGLNTIKNTRGGLPKPDEQHLSVSYYYRLKHAVKLMTDSILLTMKLRNRPYKYIGMD